MKISEIPQFVYCPTNGVMMDFDEIQGVLERFTRSYGLDLNPDFQRGHVWNQTHKEKFIEFLLQGGAVPPIRFNSPVFGGNPRARNSDLGDEVVLVDGKQRLTACREFISGQVKAFGHTINEFEDSYLILRKLNIQYIVNKLQTRKELLKWYLEMNSGAIAHSEEELNKVRDMLEKL
jgi:hypothetical protein